VADFLSRMLEAVAVTHPLHAMTVHFPIGLAGVGLFFVILALVQRNESWERAAFVCVVLTSVSTVVAAFTGYRDVLVRFDGEADLVGAKAFLALTLFFVTAALSFARSREREVLWNPSTMVLYVSGFAVSFLLCMTLGFLGGVILYGF
jgi:uncharacterized membrane protein